MNLTAAEYRDTVARPREKRNKYGAKRTVVDGIRFDSKAEASRYLDLKSLQRAGLISELDRQVPYVLQAGDNGEIVGVYKADFTYFDHREKRMRVEDVKGKDTALSAWKRKHVQAQYGIQVEIVRVK